MSYKDKFPTRTGEATGTANERVMLDKVDDDAIHTVFRDGAYMHTRLGHPNFVKQLEDEEEEETLVCLGDCGFVDTTYNYNGIGSSSGGPLQVLMSRTGFVKTDIAIKDNTAWKEAFSNSLPSNFSGLMRRVMQAEHAVNDTSLRQDVSCSFARTSGLYVNQSNSRRWVIEIDSTGIYRVDVSFCNELPNDTWASYEAYETSVFATSTEAEASALLHSFWKIKKLSRANRTKIGDAPTCYAEGYRPMYEWCGWAFNYTGALATVVCLRGHPTEASWYQTALFDVVISEASGIPSYASCTKSEESPLAGEYNDNNSNGVAAIQKPTQPGVLETLSIYSPIETGALHAPLFSFYEKTGKCVYYFDRYVSRSGTETFTSDGYPTTRTVSVSGSSLIGSYNHTAQQGSITQDPNTEPYTVTLQTQVSGIHSESRSGVFSGGHGITGSHYSVSHDVDTVSNRAYSEYTPGPSGFACSRTNSIGVSTTRWSMYSGVQSSNQLVEYWQRFPINLGGSEGEYYVSPVQTRYSDSHPSHSVFTSHNSTAVITGYDREAFSIAFSRRDYKSAYTITSSFTGTAQYLGGILFARPVGTDPGSWQPVLGATDWYHYYTGLDYELHPSTVVGWYDCEVLTGCVFGVGYVWDSPNGGFPGNSPIDTSTTTRSSPASDVTVNYLWTRVGATSKESTPETGDFHDVYTGGAVFRLWAGAAAFSTAYFCSLDINEKPKVFGVGNDLYATRSLFGFLGVF